MSMRLAARMCAIGLAGLSLTACSLFSKPEAVVVIQWAKPDPRLLVRCEDPPLPARSLSPQENDERTAGLAVAFIVCADRHNELVDVMGKPAAGP